MEALGVPQTLDDLELQALTSDSVDADVALVAGLGEQMSQPAAPAASIRPAARIDGTKGASVDGSWHKLVQGRRDQGCRRHG